MTMCKRLFSPGSVFTLALCSDWRRRSWLARQGVSGLLGPGGRPPSPADDSPFAASTIRRQSVLTKDGLAACAACAPGVEQGEGRGAGHRGLRDGGNRAVRVSARAGQSAAEKGALGFLRNACVEPLTPRFPLLPICTVDACNLCGSVRTWQQQHLQTATNLARIDCPLPLHIHRQFSRAAASAYRVHHCPVHQDGDGSCGTRQAPDSGLPVRLGVL